MKYKHNILYTHLYSPSCKRKLDYKQLIKYYNLLFCIGQKIVKFSVISMLYFKTKNSSDCYLFLGLNLGLLLTTVSHLSNCRALVRLTAPIAKSNGLMSVCHVFGALWLSIIARYMLVLLERDRGAGRSRRFLTFSLAFRGLCYYDLVVPAMFRRGHRTFRSESR